MKKRIFSAIFFLSIGVLLFISLIMTVNFYDFYREAQLNQLKIECELVKKGMESDGIDYLNDLSLKSYRITWIDLDGNVLYDSNGSAEQMPNHMEREEIRQAMETGYGESSRYSSTILQQSFYVAQRLDDDTVIRVSITQKGIIYVVLNTLYPLYVTVFIVLGGAVLLSYLISKKIVEPLNKLDLEDPLKDNKYPELTPILKRLESQHQQLKKEKETAEKTSVIRQEFTANASHELKTPLLVISGYSEMIENDMVQAKDIPEFAGKIHAEARRMNRLVEDILELSKLDAGAIGKKMGVVDLGAIAKNVVDSLEQTAKQNNINFRLHTEQCKVYGISDVLHGMIYNLCDNAIKYNKENGQIDVNIYKNDNDRVTLSVTDTGIGIPSEDIDRIFERFYRVDKSHSRNIGGTGLGLSIVKHAAMVHGAKIEVSSTLGEGTTFTVTF